MSAQSLVGQDSRRIRELQKAQQQDEFRRAMRALLMRPLMSSVHEDFPAVRRQAGRLSDWFAREAGWPLHIEREGFRLLKRPADLADETRGLPGYDRRRYVLLCLACAVLERADPQITLQLLGECMMQLAGDPTLTSCGFEFTLRTAGERRELVSVCRTLLGQDVLRRVAAEHLAGLLREAPKSAVAVGDDVEIFLRVAVEKYGRYWRKSAREPGAERELAEITLERLQGLKLISHANGEIRPLPAIARFALGDLEVHRQTVGQSLFSKIVAVT